MDAMDIPILRGLDWREVQLEPPKENPTVLGGFAPPANGQTLSKLEPLRHYMSLERPKLLRPWKNAEALAQLSNPHLKDIVCRLFDEGKMWVHWSLTQKDATTKLFAIKVYDTQSSPSEIAGGKGDFLFVLMFVIESEEGSRTAYNAVSNELLHKHLHNADREALQMRAFHLFLRQYSQQVDDFVVLEGCFDYLTHYYDGIGQYKNRLDLAITKADTYICSPESFSGNYNRKATVALCEVGESLESIGRFMDGAKVYSESASCFEAKIDLLEKAKCFLNAGVAYRRANEFELAEKAYVKSFWMNYKVNANSSTLASWDWNNIPTRPLLVSIHALYATWVATEQSIGKCFMAFDCLLLQAGFRPPASVANSFYENQQLFSIYLKKSVKTKSGARKCLMAALRAEIEVDENEDSSGIFRSHLSGCLVQEKLKDLIVYCKKPASSRDTKEGRKKDKQNARALSVVSTKVHSTFIQGTQRETHCANPECPCSKTEREQYQKKLSRCSRCQAVWYCCKSCQVQHWRNGHKEECMKLVD